MRLALFVDPDIGLAATLATALSADFTVATASTVHDGVVAIGESRLALLVVDARSFVTTSARWLRAAHPDCRIIVRHTALHGSDGAGDVRPDAIIASPVNLRDVFVPVAALCPGADSNVGLGHHTSAAMEYVARHFPARLRLVTTAHHIGVSASHLAHVFRRQTGVRFSEFVLRVRVEAARRLLRETDVPIDVIAERTGFYDASHFSRRFRHDTGHGPGAYRRLGTAPPAPLERTAWNHEHARSLR